MQHPVGDHALLANSRTAALIDPDGGVAWCCWPRVDSDPIFMSILDEDGGGVFSVRPADSAAVQSRAYIDRSLVLETVWRQGGTRLTVTDALLLGARPALVRRVHAEGGTIVVEARVQPCTARPRGSAVRIDGATLRIDAPAPLQVSAPQSWSIDGLGARCRFEAAPGRCAVLALGEPAGTAADLRGAIDATVRRWRLRLAGIDDVPVRPEAARTLGEGHCRRLLGTSAAVLSGLQQDGGGIVAAPTTSLPQWPRSARCWDYRLCWLRDAALAGEALLRLRMVERARGLGLFIAGAVAGGAVPPVVRVDGGPAPRERLRAGVPGYRGARPVRFGNAAAAQLQVDVAGEVVDFATMLAAAGPLPAGLADAVPVLAEWIAAGWRRPDHGIWEIRGRSRRYTHSRLMAWVGLDRAARLAAAGRVAGDPSRWRAAASEIRDAILSSPGALELHSRGGGADAALGAVVESGLVDPHHPMALSTLDRIAAELNDCGLLQRHRGSQDTLDDPCAPFIFPTLWMASAETAAGRDGSGWLRAAAATASPLGLFGEVRDPESGGPFGNYPHVQTHASLVCALAPLPPPVMAPW